MPDSLTLTGGEVTVNRPLLNLAQTWNNATVNFTGFRLDIAATSSGADSKWIELQSDGQAFWYVGRDPTSADVTPYMRLIASDGNNGALRLAAGALALQHRDYDLVRCYWDGAAGGAAVIKGMGANRLSIESASAIVHISDANRYEWEGNFSAPAVEFVGYQKASANGVPINITNTGQIPVVAVPLHVTNVQSAAASIAVLRDGTDSGGVVDRVDFLAGGGVVQTLVPDQSAYRSRGYLVTGAGDTPAMVVEGAWDTTANPSAIRVDITNTASGDGSLLLDLQLDSVCRFAVDKAGSTVQAGPAVLASYDVAGLPPAADFTGGMIYVPDESGGSVPAFSDGTDWLRVTDRAIVS